MRKESSLRSFFCPLREDNLVLTVDTDRVYRVYFSEDKLDIRGTINYSDGQTLCSFDSYKEALKYFKGIVQRQKETYEFNRTKRMKEMGLDPAAFDAEFKTWLNAQVSAA